ncbi:hypothetical protein ACQ4XT_18105 [Halobacillus faecis]
MKKTVFLVLLFLLVFTSFLGTTSASVNAEEEILNEADVQVEEDPLKDPVFYPEEPNLLEETDGTLKAGNEFDVGTNSIIRTVKYSKENVSTYTEWSPFRRVSDNVVTGNHTGSIKSDRTTTFTVSASGGYSNLGFSLGKTVTSAKSYTLNVPKYSRVYMAYRVKYNVEKGTRVTKTGSVVRSKTPYTVKTPAYGEYKLLKY